MKSVPASYRLIQNPSCLVQILFHNQLANDLNFICHNIFLLMQQSQPQAIYQNDFYQHLTELIRAYKHVFVMIKNDADYEPNITQIKKIMQEEQQLINKYDFSLQSYKQFHSAYHRFICRLVQNLAPTKIKVSSEEPRILLVQQLLGKLESCINFHRKEKNLALMFKRIFVYIAKFCQGCEMLLSCYSQNDAVEALRKEVEEEKNEGQKIVAKGASVQPQSNFQKIMGVFNKRFITISCLDLDYNCYKSYCFMSRNDTDDQLYKDLQIRNAATFKAISSYSRHFSQFLKRKEKNIVRKNRFRELKQNIKTNQPPADEQRSIANHTTLQMNTQILQKTQESGIVSLPILKQQQKRIILQTQEKKETNRKLQSTPVRRGHYEMKSIYLTINKFHDKFQNSNRFMFNYSMTKQQESNRKYTTIKINQTPLKKTQMVNQSVMVQREKNQTCQSPAFDQMPYPSKMMISPRVSIIHKANDKKGDKRNIRITNLTFRNHHTRLNSLLDPQSIAFY